MKAISSSASMNASAPFPTRAEGQMAVCRAPALAAAASGVLGALWRQVKLQET